MYGAEVRKNKRKRLNESLHGFLLFFGSRICGLPAKQSAFVADAYGLPVVALAVRAYQVNVPAIFNRSVSADVVVIADAGISLRPVPLVDFLGRNAPPFSFSSRTMYNYLSEFFSGSVTAHRRKV